MNDLASVIGELWGLRKESYRKVMLRHGAPNDVRYAMNQFVISVACYVVPVSGDAKAEAERIGRVSVDMGETACQVPYAPDAIRKVAQRGGIGKKRRSAKC